MCGIIAFIGERDAFNVIYNGLYILQNRGYDSAGICTIDNNSFINRKYASENKITSLDKLNNYKNGNCYHIGIGHTRWATHGEKTDVNAHPHIDYKNIVAVVHNGIIENYQELKQMLAKNKYNLISQTDTEVIPNLISYYWTSQNCTRLEAIKMAINDLQGTYGLVIMFKGDKNKLYVARNGSPVLVGSKNNSTIITSESSGFMDIVEEYVQLKDGDIYEIDDTIKLSEKFPDYKIYHNENKEFETLVDYEYWTIKEIMEQNITVLKCLANRLSFNENTGKHIITLSELDEHKEKLLQLEHLIIIACGSSYYSGLLGVKYLRKFKFFNTMRVLDASEFDLDDIPKKGKTGILVISQSGETKDVHRAMELVKDNTEIFTIAMVNVKNSLIALTADTVLYLNAGRENGVASTKAYVSQAVALIMIGLWFEEHVHTVHNNLMDEFAEGLNELSNGIKQNFDTYVPAKKLASILLKNNKKDIFILGKGENEPITYEGALKIKELSYLHAEGYPGSALKHGPYALIDKDTPIIFLIGDDEHKNKMISVMEEVRSRNAYIIVLTDCKDTNTIDNIANYVIKIKKTRFSNLCMLITLQMLAYELAIQQELNPDQPRNLAKVVTVD